MSGVYLHSTIRLYGVTLSKAHKLLHLYLSITTSDTQWDIGPLESIYRYNTAKVVQAYMVYVRLGFQTVT